MEKTETIKLTEKQEIEFEKLFNNFISSDAMYLPDKMAYKYFYIKGITLK